MLVGTVLVLGLITGLTCLQQSLTSELQDLSGAFGALDQSYCFSGHSRIGCCDRICAFNSGSCFLDPADCAADAKSHPHAEHKAPPFITYDVRQRHGAPCPDCGRVHEHQEPPVGRDQERSRMEDSRDDERRSVRDPQNSARSGGKASDKRSPLPESRRRKSSDSDDSRNDDSGRRSGDSPDARGDEREEERSRSSRRSSDAGDRDQDDEDNAEEEDGQQAARSRNPSDYVLTTHYSAMLGCDHCGGSGCDSCQESRGCSSCGSSRPDGSCRSCGGYARYASRSSCGSCGSYRCGGCGDYGYGPRERCTNVRHMRVSEWPSGPGPQHFVQQIGYASNPPFPVYTPFHGNPTGPMPNGASGPVPPVPPNGPAPEFGPGPTGFPHDGYARPPVPGAPPEFRGPAGNGPPAPPVPGAYLHGQVPPGFIPQGPAPSGVQNQWGPRPDGAYGPSVRVVYYWAPWNPYAGNRHEPRFPEYVW